MRGRTMSRLARIACWAVGTTLLLTSFSILQAGTIDVVAQEQGGRGIASVKITAIRIDMATANPLTSERVDAITDSEGHAVLSGLHPGTYGVFPGPMSDPLLVSAEDPATGGGPTVT